MGRATWILGGLLALVGLGLTGGCGGDDADVVLYCGVDQDQSQLFADTFEQATGLRVDYHGESEKSRSVGLPQRLVFEKDRPRADVYWSNEIMHMVHLGRIGILDELPAGVAEHFPEAWRDPQGRYVAFGARARVFLVNTELLEEKDYPKSLEDLLNPKYHEMGLVTCMAEPLTGTTYTHAVGLLTEDEEGAKAFFQAIAAQRDAGRIKVVLSNGQVMQAVKDSSRKVAFGLTDTDDAWIAIQEGKPVKVVYPDQHRRGAFLIPNTIALVKGRRHPAAAERLLRWLVSEETEAALAQSRSAQMPLRASVPVPQDGPVLRPGEGFKVQPVDWQAVGKNVDRWRDYLISLFKK